MFGKINANAPVNLTSGIELLTISGQGGSITCAVNKSTCIRFRKGIKMCNTCGCRSGMKKSIKKVKKSKGKKKK
jgi:hypothetical protein